MAKTFALHSLVLMSRSNRSKKIVAQTAAGLRRLRAPRFYARFYGNAKSVAFKRFKLNVKSFIPSFSITNAVA